MDFEKLGLFYLGRHLDATSKSVTDEPLLYDSRDLTTHAVCIGMTGSGKTGLCVGLLEEAAIDGIPSIIIDPKGDMANLMLRFPKLQASDFLPWINRDAASRKGLSADEYAQETADLWKNGLADWGQSPARIKALNAAVDTCVFTPGSSAGIPIQLLKSFSPPSQEVLEDNDLFQERIESAACSLLALVGINADPIQSREYILIAKIIEQAWSEGQSLSIEDLIIGIQSPGFDKVGIVDLESFYPKKERVAFSMQLNNLLASPGFSSWMEGVPLDADQLLYTDEGKPRISIISIAHLSDSERMFFVTLLLNEMVSWMRSQPGTSSLRALLYMDEIYGYFPPTSSPPSKKPMLMLLKQARAFGLGVVLSTQNPVDLDYKGLSNTGTWFVGRLQTERDKARILDGLEGATAENGGGFNRSQLDKMLSALSGREFILHNVHEDEPELFKTRWALSYLAGPMTREQIKSFKQTIDIVPLPPSGLADQPPALIELKKTKSGPAPTTMTRLKQLYLEPTAETPDGQRLVYRPALLARAKVHYVKSTVKLDHWENLQHLTAVKKRSKKPAWSNKAREIENLSATEKPPGVGEFVTLPSIFSNEDAIEDWMDDYELFIYRENPMRIWQCKDPKAYSEPGMTRRAFRSSLDALCRETRDVAIAKSRDKYESKLRTLQRRMETAEAAVDREKEQLSQTKMQTMISIGTTVFGAFLGRKKVSSTNMNRAARAMKSASRSSRDKGDVKRALEKVESVNQQIRDVENSCQDDLDKIREKYAPANLEINEVDVPPRKSDIDVAEFVIVWEPWFIDEDGFSSYAAESHDPTSEE